MGHYRWRELEAFSIQTFSNIITFIQFATIPIVYINSIGQSQQNNFKEILSKKFESIINVFLSPFDFIKKFNQIIAPIQPPLSITVIFATISYLYIIFLLPSWNFFLFFIDLFMAPLFLTGFVFISRNYEEERKLAITLIIIGVIYFIFRILFLFYPIIRYKKINWHVKVASQITAVFLSRLKNDKNKEELNMHTKEIEDEIDRHDYTIQFDDHHFSFKRRIFDIIITFFIWVLLLVFIIVGWKKIFSNRFKNQQLIDLVFVCDYITYFLFIGICIRLILNVIWLIKPKDTIIFKIFSKMKSIAYRIMHFLIGIILIPIIKNSIKSFPYTKYQCNKNYYLDTRSNTDSFLQYFMERNKPLCVECTQTSMNSVSMCKDVCNFGPNLHYLLLTNSMEIRFTDFNDLYMTQLQLQHIFYFLIFPSLLGLMYYFIVKILEHLPAPTQNIECKYQTLIYSIKSTALNAFHSLRYKSSLYFVNFLQIKIFITGFSLSFRINNSEFLIPFFYSTSSFIIALSQIFSKPYISILHNIVNFISYAVSGIISLLIGFHATNIIKLPSIAGNIFTIIIIIVPIASVLITPFFVKKDPLLVPTEFDLLRIQKWDKKLNKLFQFRKEKSKVLKKKKEKKNEENNSDDEFDENEILFEDEPSISLSYFQHSQNNEDREHDYLIGQFDLFTLAPIIIQKDINSVTYDKEGNVDQKYNAFKQDVKSVWIKQDLEESDFVLATNEMMHSSRKLIECICHNNLKRLFNFSLIVSSALLGWCLSCGTVRWHKINGVQWNDFYLRCNMLPNGTYPAFGTY